MEKLIDVQLKNGKTIKSLPRELDGLRQAGLLAEEKEYTPAPAPVTKDNPVPPAQQEPVKKVPVNISKNSIKGGRPKKV